MPFKPDVEIAINSVLAYPDIVQALQSPRARVTDLAIQTQLRAETSELMQRVASEIADVNRLEAQTVDKLMTLFDLLRSAQSKFGPDSGDLLESASELLYVKPDGSLANSSEGLLAPNLVRQRIDGVLAKIGSAGDIVEFADEMIRRSEIDTAQERLEGAVRTANSALFGVTLLRANEIINEANDTTGQRRLFVSPMVAQPGFEQTLGRALSEVFDSANEIPTAARRGLDELINSLSGGSIGIAGPRGAGKSTLLASICRSRPASDVKTIAVYTSAPVEYDAREFQLHIFSSLCLAVLDANGTVEDRLATSEEGRRASSYPNTLLRYLRFGRLLGLVAGAIVTIIGVALASLLVTQSEPHTGSTVVVAPSPMLKSLPVVSQRRLVSKFPASSAPTLKPAQQEAAATATSEPRIKTIYDAYGIDSGALVHLGIVLLFIGFALNYIVVTEKRRYSSNRSLLSTPMGENPLVLTSQRILRNIRFQRSYSSGWSGALKIVPGVELSTNEALSIAQRQETLPEVVHRFRSFVALIAAAYDRVVIAIDELDKLESDEKAYEFLNDIKSIFSIPKCVYLVSVSESAISNFERRGLAFRDAFDSTFDDIWCVDYLTLEESLSLLNARVLNLPRPFGRVCHALSAGLPRDLIRAARAMLEWVRHNSAANDVGSVAAGLIEKDVRGKIRATIIAARRIELEPERSQFFTWLESLDATAPAGTVTEDAAFDGWRSNPAEADRTNLQALQKAARELIAFMDYAATFRALFRKAYAANQSAMAADDRWVVQLAEVRQGFEVSVGTASALLAKLRKTQTV